MEHTLHLDLPHRVTASESGESGEPPRRDRYSLKGTVHRKAKSWSTLEFPKESIKSHPLTIPWEFINNRIYLDSKQSDGEAPPEAQRTARSLCSPDLQAAAETEEAAPSSGRLLLHMHFFGWKEHAQVC